MKPARILILLVALGAGGFAAFLASGDNNKEAPAPVPVVQIETVDVLVAKADIGMGQSVSEQNIHWQSWPASAANSNFVRKPERPEAVQQIAGSIARTPFLTGEPIREGKLIKANGSGFLAAMRPASAKTTTAAWWSIAANSVASRPSRDDIGATLLERFDGCRLSRSGSTDHEEELVHGVAPTLRIRRCRLRLRQTQLASSNAI